MNRVTACKPSLKLMNEVISYWPNAHNTVVPSENAKNLIQQSIGGRVMFASARSSIQE